MKFHSCGSCVVRMAVQSSAVRGVNVNFWRMCMRGIMRGWLGFRWMTSILVLCAVACFSPDRASVLAAGSQQPAGGGADLYLPLDAVPGGDRHQLSNGPVEVQQHGMTDVLSEGIDGEDELSMKHSVSLSPMGEASAKAGEISGAVESLRGKPPIPPPDPESRTLTVNDHVLLAKNTTATAKDGGKGTSEPAPEPKTSKSSSVSTPLLVGAGIAIIAGAVAAAGGGSDSDASVPSTPTTPSGDTSSGSSEVINLSSLVRIGDDTDYNGNHPDKFKQNRPSGTSWTDSFNISNANSVSSATFKYTVAGSKVANPVYVNGKLAGRLCNPGNTAWNVESCSIGITGLIRSGSNEIKIKCAIDESDTDTPYDDVELYDLRIELTR